MKRFNPRVLSAFAVVGVLIAALLLWLNRVVQKPLTWSEGELAILQTLVLDDVSHQDIEKNLNLSLAELGQALFFDTDFSIDGNVACASCHQPDLYFTDGEPLATQGIDETDRHTPTIVGISESPWFFWDGRKDSLWSQALGPLESPVEHGSNRMHYTRLLTTKYAQQYQQHFGDLPDFSDANRFPEHATPEGANPTWKKSWQGMTDTDRSQVNQVFANMGQAIAEYEKLIQPEPSRFDRFAYEIIKGDGSEILTKREQYGLKMFLDIEKTACLNCHNGPLLTNHDFQATSVPDIIKPTRVQLDPARSVGVFSVLKDEFNCFAGFTDSDCSELKFAKTEGEELVGAFKVPTLRGITNTAPYMHRGQLTDLDEVLNFYNRAVPIRGRHMELMPLRLLPHEIKQLKAFLLTLDAGINADARWLQDPNKAKTILEENL